MNRGGRHDEQVIEHAHIDVSPCEHFARVAAHDQIGDRIWVQANGQMTVRYEATVAPPRVLLPLYDLSEKLRRPVPGHGQV